MRRADRQVGRGGSTGSWRPFLAQLGESPRRRREVKLKAVKRTPRVLTADQVTVIVDACDHRRDQLLFALLAGTGMRIGEALGLRHEDIDTAGRVVRVQLRRNANRARAKTGARDIPVTCGTSARHSSPRAGFPPGDAPDDQSHLVGGGSD